MSAIDFSHLSVEQRLELIGEIWDSIEADQAVLTPAQAAELDRRIASVEEDIKDARPADVVLAELQSRYR